MTPTDKRAAATACWFLAKQFECGDVANQSDEPTTTLIARYERIAGELEKEAKNEY